MKTPIVAIVGRPNTGKSTLFNKIAGNRIAITSAEAGTTRDRIFYKVECPEVDFFLVDTGGLEFGKGNTTIESDMRSQARVAIDEADLILFIVEGKGDLTVDDFRVADLLRKTTKKKTVFLIANKCDQSLEDTQLAHLYELGLGDPVQISALNRVGIDILVDQITSQLKDQHFLVKHSSEYRAAIKQEKNHLNLALVGKPNVGKSSLINALLNQDRLIVSEIPGTTRDTTDSLVKNQGKTYNFIDTAGLKKRGKIEKGIEHFSALRSMMAIERADIALLVIDSSQPISHQDQQIANYILTAYKGLIILVNKWDIKEDDEQKEEERRAFFIHKLQKKFSFAPWIPVIFTSATEKKNLNMIFEQVEKVNLERKKRIQTRELNTFLSQTTMDHEPSGTKRFPPKIFYITQATIDPPEFVVFVNKKSYFHFSYLRYLENRLREKFGFIGTPIKMDYREKERRFSGGKK